MKNVELGSTPERKARTEHARIRAHAMKGNLGVRWFVIGRQQNPEKKLFALLAR
jgi:hypothetical protein